SSVTKRLEDPGTVRTSTVGSDLALLRWGQADPVHRDLRIRGQDTGPDELGRLVSGGGAGRGGSVTPLRADPIEPDRDLTVPDEQRQAGHLEPGTTEHALSALCPLHQPGLAA